MRHPILWLPAVATAVALVVTGCSGQTESLEPTTGGTFTAGPDTTSVIADPPPSATPDNSEKKQLNEGVGAVFQDANTGGVNLQSTTTYLKAVVKDVDAVWAKWFVNNGMTEPMVSYHIVQPGKVGFSRCTLSGSNEWKSGTQNAMFCPDDDETIGGVAYDGALWLPVETFASMWSGNIFGRQAQGKVGDVAAAALVAHEYGHKVQQHLSVIYKVSAPPNPQIELIADCFTGVWAHVAFGQAKVSAADLEIVLHTLGAIGDTNGSHGTNEQRMDALRSGLNGTTDNPVPALPSNCTRKYWPALPMK